MIRRLLCRTLLGAAFLVLALVPAGSAQESEQALQQEIQALKEGQAEIKKELQEIRKLLQARPQPAAPAQPDVRDRVFDLADAPTRGPNTAKLTLIEFSDYQCGYCARHTRQTQPKIEKEYIATGKLRYAPLDVPLEQIHKQAFKAAEAARCARDQGKYWEMHDRLFESQRALEPWNAHAEALGLDVTRFEDCLSSGRYADAVRRDMAEASKAGAASTPSYVLGATNPGDPTKVKGLVFIRGAQPFASFKAAIDKALTSDGVQ